MKAVAYSLTDFVLRAQTANRALNSFSPMGIFLDRLSLGALACPSSPTVQVLLMVCSDNVPAQRLYECLGYLQIFQAQLFQLQKCCD